ncbi:MAG TPA: hypothetical protein VN687_10200 [Blastocatellia bacterium]|nr:hypothetical protein [Blastocatellia bacterium]
MSDPQTIGEEVSRLLELLNAQGLRPYQLESEVQAFSEESKNALVAQLARSVNPPSPGKVLARLPSILTDENRSDMANVFITNLRSPNPEARKFSLFGLSALEHPNVVEFALASLRDDNDQVLTAACGILLLKSGQDPRIRAILQDLYSANADNENLYMSMSLLKTHLES